MSETFLLVPVRDLTDAELEALFTGSDNDDEIVQAITEMDRRERAARRRAARRAADEEWFLFAHDQWEAAEAACRGNLLSREGLAAGIDPFSLWSAPASQAARYASEELRDFWAASPRITPAEYTASVRRARRAEREQHLTSHCTACGWDFGHWTTQQTCGSARACERRQAAGNPALGRRRPARTQADMTKAA